MTRITDLTSVEKTALLKTILTPNAYTLDVQGLCKLALAIPDWQRNAFEVYKEYELNWHQDNREKGSYKHVKDPKYVRSLNVAKVHDRTGKSRARTTNRDIEANIVLGWGRKLVQTGMLVFAEDLEVIGKLQGKERRLKLEKVLRQEVIMKIEVLCSMLGHKVDIGVELERLRPPPEDRQIRTTKALT